MFQHKMTKKDKILNMFRSVEWNNGAKYFSEDDFKNAGLDYKIEVGEKYNDVFYAKRILKSMGYNVAIGHMFYVTKK